MWRGLEHGGGCVVRGVWAAGDSVGAGGDFRQLGARAGRSLVLPPRVSVLSYSVLGWSREPEVFGGDVAGAIGVLPDELLSETSPEIPGCFASKVLRILILVY